jgi:hypothetical protein
LHKTVRKQSAKKKKNFATVAIFDATTKSFVKSTATEKGYYEIQVTNVAFMFKLKYTKPSIKNVYKYQNRLKSQF